MAYLDLNYLGALIRDTHRGSTDAFAAIFYGTVDRLYRHASRTLDSIYDVQDCIRNVYTRLWNMMPAIKGPRQFRIRFLAICRSAEKKIIAKEKAPSASDGRGKSSQAKDRYLDPEIRDDMLIDILGSAGAGELTTPTDRIISYNSYRHHRSRLISAIMVILVVIAVMLPLLYFPPFYTVTRHTYSNGEPYFTVHMESQLIKVRSVTASVNSRAVPVFRDSDDDFRVEPVTNGKVYIRVTLNNRMSKVTIRYASGVDDDPPEVTKYVYRNGMLYLKLDDENSVNFRNTYLIDSDGSIIRCEDHSKKTKTCRFRVSDDTSYTFHAEDIKGNTLNVDINVGELN
jgi:hypothetical protein